MAERVPAIREQVHARGGGVRGMAGAVRQIQFSRPAGAAGTDKRPGEGQAVLPGTGGGEQAEEGQADGRPGQAGEVRPGGIPDETG